MRDKIKLNILTTLIIQFLTVLSGMILPKLVLSAFGSEVNGLVSSITQFLSFISLIEGGLGAVVLAELYQPIEEKNRKKINSIFSTTEKFFKKISLVFLAVTLILSLVYPFVITSSYSFSYISSLILIISITTFVQYFFSITYRLLLQANQTIYIANLVSAICIVLNLILTVIIIKVYPNIHIVKLGAAFIYLIQPLIYKKYVNKYFEIDENDIEKDTKLLKNRWSGFAQNVSYFINTNTDIIVITLFLNLKEVSVYSIYMMIFNGLRTLVASLSSTYQTMLGKYLAKNNFEILKNKFLNFAFLMWNISNIFFGTCLLLVNVFISLYTTNISDINYIRFPFSIIMTIAQLLFCAEDSYRMMILAAGHFKETNTGAMLEAIINIVISLLLVNKLGILGVAIGTLAAYIFKLFYLVIYLKHNIIYLKYKDFIKNLAVSFLMITTNIIILLCFQFEIHSFFSFILSGMIIFMFEFFLSIIFNLLFFRDYLKFFFKKIFKN